VVTGSRKKATILNYYLPPTTYLYTMPPVLETERLLLRQFTSDDAQFILELVNTAGWLKFIGDRNVHSIEDAVKYLDEGPINSYKQNDFGLSCIALKNSGQSIGMCGLLRREFLPDPDLGFAILPEFQGHGYMQEVSGGYLNYIHQCLKLPAVLAITVPGNQRSISLLERLGFSFMNELHLPGEAEPVILYRVDFEPDN
jgi:ribosomal-protein-alanine N-acetyltransferase